MVLMIFMHCLGIVKVEHQKLEIPARTVLINNSLPVKESDLALQLLTFPFTCWIRGSHLAKDSFLVTSGTPKYLTGSWPCTNPTSETM